MLEPEPEPTGSRRSPSAQRDWFRAAPATRRESVCGVLMDMPFLEMLMLANVLVLVRDSAALRIWCCESLLASLTRVLEVTTVL